MANKAQAESYARQECWKFKQRMYVVQRGAQFFAASDVDLKNHGGDIVAKFEPIKHRAGARSSGS
jgi:hypothetical protein